MNLKMHLLCLCCFITGTLSAEVVSAPVGFLQVTFSPATTTFMAIPLQKNPVAVGPVTAVGASTLTDSNATWASGQFADPAKPYFVKWTSGLAAGRYYLITANTSNKLTVDTRGANLSGLVSVNDRYQVIAAPTLGSLFGTGSVPFLTGASKSAADYVQIWNGSAWISYWHTGANWKMGGATTSQNNTILYPDEGILVYRRGTTPLTIAVVGEASMIAEQTEAVGPATTSAANRYPVDVKLKDLGLLALPNWVSAASSSSADRVQIREGTSWATYWHTGTNWKKSGSSVSQDNAPISGGAGYLILRKSSSVGVDAFATQSVPY